MGFWDWATGWMRERGPSRDDGAPAEANAATAVLDHPAPGDEAAVDRWWAPAEGGLVEPLVMARPELTPEARALEQILLSHFDSHDLDMPPLPHVAEKVLGHLGGRDYDTKKIAGEIGEDQVIAAAVLRMVNSVFYRATQQITAIHPAVNRLGANALRTLLMHQALRAAAFQRKGGNPELANVVWNRSLAGAVVMRSLSAFTSVDAEEAFMVGLLHDIGNVIVLREAQKQQAALRYRLDLPTFDYLCAETHQEFGELVADAWSMPPALKSLLSDHHTHPAEDDPLRMQRLLIIVTDAVCAMLGFGAEAVYQLLDMQAVRELGLHQRGDFEDLLIELPGLVELNIASVSF